MLHIIILGANSIGHSLAANLVVEGHNVTIVDQIETALGEMQERYDLRTVYGHCANPRILAEAGAAEADMILAVTDNDEVNIVACLVAKSVFKIPLKIACVSSADYFFDSHQFFAGEQSPIDIFINPTQLITQSLIDLIEHSGALRIFNFADGQIKLIATKPSAQGKLIGKSASELNSYLPDIRAKIIAVYRHNQLMPMDTPLDLKDDVLFIAEKNKVSEVLSIICAPINQSDSKKIMIIGGGHIGSLTAQNLQAHHQVKLIEQNKKLCEKLALQLESSLVLCSNGCDTYLLRNENVEDMDCFVALTNSDADNIVSALHSKQLGAKQVISLVNRDAYLSLIINGYINIDIAVSPQQITISAILRHLHRGNIVQAYSLRQGSAEALEIKVDSSAAILKLESSQALPPHVTIAAIIRQNQILIPKTDMLIREADRVILFVSDKKQIPAVDSLFAVNNGG